ncbi:dynamin family protein [Dyella mobilis]|uniref:Dynamin family protein n=1 Tax=Dyella mobilis TaxID=1849582 RepID=A0ABS2KCE8_9GAMM|nr:dynamin family protein [Dyella mobilis]MBM7128720.1 dynamin family protein [Dyella mobilis]GLQ99048.1 hypothetical protein GCM10007863_34680 [Dyella mobilis]
MSTMYQSDQMELSSILREASGVAGIPADIIAALQKRVDEHLFNIVIAGEFKRGKSTFINALLGDDVLPMGVVPLTSVITMVRSGLSASITIQFANGDSKQAPLSQLPEYATERGNPGNIKDVKSVTVYHPSHWLNTGVQLVDTPGVGSVHEQNSEVTHHYLPQSDAVIFVISADQPLSRNELDFLACIRGYAGKVFCLLNKVDLLSSSELQESIAFTGGVLRKTIGDEIPILPISARMALEAYQSDCHALREKSGLVNFEYALHHFLRNESERVWIDSIRRQVLQCLTERELSNDLEIRAMELPLEQLEVRLAAFSKKKAELLKARENMDCLLLSDCQKIIKGRLEPDLAALKARLQLQLHDHLNKWAASLRQDGSIALQKGLEELIVDDVRGGFDAWRKDEGIVLGVELEAMYTQFWGQMCNHIAELAKYSASIFEVTLTPIKPGARQKSEKDFLYKFWYEPSGLSLLGSFFLRLLPTVLSYPILLRHARMRADELVETQSGRLRHDFEEHITKDAKRFQQEMDGRYESIGSNIEKSIRAGMQSKALTESEVMIRRAELSTLRVDIDCVKKHLLGYAKVAA